MLSSGHYIYITLSDFTPIISTRSIKGFQAMLILQSNFGYNFIPRIRASKLTTFHVKIVRIAH